MPKEASVAPVPMRFFSISVTRTPPSREEIGRGRAHQPAAQHNRIHAPLLGAAFSLPFSMVAILSVGLAVSKNGVCRSHKSGLWMVMRARQLEVFIAVMRAGTVTAAARTLNISQPALSQILLHTEDELGFTLFER